jgi:amino acid adenylation domain-containing protein
MTTTAARQPSRGLTARQRQFLTDRVRAAQSSPDSTIPRLAQDREAAVSFAQERLWLIDRLNRHDHAYNVYHALRLHGELDRAALRAALDGLVARHETLRTVFVPGDGLPVQRVLPAALVDLVERDLGRDDVDELVRAFCRAPFDLSAGPVFRAQLIRRAPDDHVLVLALPHIATDGWSTGVLARDLATLYGGTSPAEPRVTYRDYAVWQRNRMGGEHLRDELDHWRRELADQPQTLDLFTDFPRPPTQQLAGADHRVEIPADVAARLHAVAKRFDVNLYTLLVTAVRVLLHAHTGQDRFILASTISGRDHPELEEVVGCFINTITLRGDLSGDPTFAAAMRRERDTVLRAFGHQEVPFELLVRELVAGRDAARNPLAQVFVQLDRGFDEGWTLPGLDVRQLPVSGDVAKFDLSFFFRADAERLVLTLEYATALFTSGTAERLGERLVALLASAAAQPEAALGRLGLLPPAEHRALGSFNDTVAPARTPEITDVLARRARDGGDRPAVTFHDATISYAELDARVNRLANFLRSRGVGRGDLVGVFLRRGLDLPVCLLAALRAGTGYVPLNPGEPADRIALILEDAAPALLLTQDGLDDQLPTGGTVLRIEDCREQVAAMPSTAPDVTCDPDELAYVIFTSGSTGRPKGVAVPRGALTNFLGSMAHEPGMGQRDTLVAVTTPSFDIAALELFLPLLVGGRLVIADETTTLDSSRLRDLISRTGATIVQATPATWRLLAGAPELAGCKALVGGEALTSDVAGPLVASTAEVWNMYGPTETTIWSTVRWIGDADCARPGPLPIGRPIDNTTCHIVDEHGRRTPIGVPGELLIGGQGVTRGYLGRPSLTAERFVPDPGSPGRRLYRTGDLARYLRDGDIEFLGRNDHQVKIRGFRIEAGEIEAQLGRHAEVSQAVVTAHEFGPGDVRLVAYLTPARPDTPPSADQLRVHLAGKLPDYMIPGTFEVLEALPLTPNRKVDRKALPAPAVRATSAGTQPPRTATERLVAEIWESLLGRPVPVVRADFFELGGHSLLAVEAVNLLNRARGASLPVSAILDAPTVAGLGARLDAAAGQPVAAAVPRVPRDQPLRPSPAQQRLWFLEQLNPGSAEYHIPIELTIRGPLDREALRLACQAVVERQETLRTRLRTDADGQPVAVVEEAGRFELGLDDAAGDHVRADELADAEARRPFDLGRDPLLRARLIRIAPDEHTLVLTVHHAAADGASLEVLREGLAKAYAAARDGQRPDLGRPDLGYADLAAWRHRHRDDARHRADLAYWRRRLADLVPLDLPTDRDRPPQRDSAGAAHRFRVPDDVATAVERLARERRTTPFTVLLAAYQAALGRWAGTDDVAVTTAVSDRAGSDAIDLMGMFVDTVVLRADLSDDPSFTAMVDQARQRVREALAHQRATFDRVVDEVATDRIPGRLPLSPAHFTLQTSVAPPWTLDGLEVERRPERIVACRHELALGLERSASGYDGLIEYVPTLFDAGTVAAFATRFTDLLRTVTTDPEHRPGPFPASVAAAPATTTPGPAGRPPAGPAEEAVARVWTEVLGTAVTDAHADFFAIGGHSLLAARVRLRLQEILAVDLPMHRLFRQTTVAGLADVVQREVEADLAGLSEEELHESLKASS